MSDVSRRRFLGVTTGAALSWGMTGSASAASATGTDGDWRAVDAPTDRALHDVARAAGRVYAVGGGGVVLERTDAGEWRTVAANGPDGNGSNLHAAASDGERVWVAGASGALAVLDAATGAFTTHRAPDDVTNEFAGLALVGSGDDATVHVADSSGHVHVSRGRTEDAIEGGEERDWAHVTPGSGAALRDVTADGNRVVAVDANAAVFETRDGGASWERIGIDDADAALRGVTVAGGTAHVVGGALYSETADGWDVADPCEATLADVGIGPCGCVHAVGANGTVLHRPGHEIPAGATLAKWLGRWETTRPVSGALDALVLGAPHVAVGANGTIVER